MSYKLPENLEKEFKNLFQSDIKIDSNNILDCLHENGTLNEDEKSHILRTIMSNMCLQMTFFDKVKSKISDNIRSEFSDTVKSYKTEINDLNEKINSVTNDLNEKINSVTNDLNVQLSSKLELENQYKSLELEKNNLEEENNLKSKPSNQISILRKYDDKIVERDNQIANLKKELERLNFKISQYETNSNEDKNDKSYSELDQDKEMSNTVDEMKEETNKETHNETNEETLEETHKDTADNQNETDEEEEMEEMEEITIKKKKYLYDGEKYFYECDNNETAVGYKDSKGKYKFYKKK